MIEKDAISSLPSQYIVSAKNDSKMADYVVSGCEWRTRNILSSFWYSGDIIKAELYKIEKLSESQLMQLSTKIREEMSIDKKLNIAIYAPTFRKDSGVSCYNLDYEMLISVLERRFGGEWCVIVRLHPNISYMSEELSYSDKIINGTNYPDIRDLLQISQVLITDYSGCMFDAFRIDKYVFLYATDIQEYLADDRGLYFDLNSLPAPLAQNNEELAENILKFDDKKYIGDVEKLLSEFGYYNNNGVQIINDIIKNILKGEHTKS